MSSLAAYLSKNYLTASNATSSDLSTRPKKRRKKDKTSSNTDLIIADDDEDLSLSKNDKPEDDNDETPTYDSNIRSAEFRRAKKNNWKTIGGTDAADQATADRILADAVRDSDARRQQAEVDDEAPAVAGETIDTSPPPPPQRKAGLQTAAETAALSVAAAKSSKKQRRYASSAAAEAEETVYRDATGRRIDISMKRAEARAAEQEKLRQEKREKEEAMGDVQRREKEERRQAVEEAKFLTVARYADDEGMNQELRKVGRWGDPMAGYVSNQKEKQGVDGGGGGATATGSNATKKEYQGAAAPNRYGIRPGWRWDGVDRGNGFEGEWFQARGRKSRNENLEYQWQMDE